MLRIYIFLIFLLHNILLFAIMKHINLTEGREKFISVIFYQYKMKKLILANLPEIIKRKIDKKNADIINIRAYATNREIYLIFHVLDNGVLTENNILNFIDLL